MSFADLAGWDRLRHGGLLLDTPRLRRVAEYVPAPLHSYYERELRKLAAKVLDENSGVSEFVVFVFEQICGFTVGAGSWQRGTQISAEWGRRAVAGDTIKPRHLWRSINGAILPVFIDNEPRLGIGRGRKAASQVIQWLRAGSEKLAVLTNGRQWRLLFAGLDFDAWCEWDVDLWFEEGALSPQVHALRTLLSPALWTPPAKDAPSPLLEAILDSRKGQADLSATLGERVREAVELLVQGHGDVLKESCADVNPADIYRAAVRVIMRMVVVLFAESRELLPRDNALYHAAYGLTGLLEELEKIAARGGNRLARSWNAWPRVLALFRLVHQGSHHPALPVPAYGGELFAPGDAASPDGLQRALAVFETAVFDREILPDRDVHRILDFITRTRVKIRQGRSSTWIPAPVDFSDLSSEYIGILYEGLLDFELKTAPPGDPVIFLAVGNQPALPLSRLEGMDDRALANLLEKMKDTSKAEEGGEEESEEDEVDEPEEAGSEESEESETEEVKEAEAEEGDERHATRTRAEMWARRAVEVGKLVSKPRGALTPEKRLAFEETVARKARQLVIRVILPGEWYLVRWGGTRKGAGTFYTRPGLAVPTVQRTLRPLCFEERGRRNEEQGGEGNGKFRAEGKRVSGSDCLAEGNGAVRGDIQGDGENAGARAIRIDSTAQAGRDLNPIEHSGGTQPPIDRGLSASSADGARFGGGSPDAAASGRKTPSSPENNDTQSAAAIRGMLQDTGNADPEIQERGRRNEELEESASSSLIPHSSFLIPKKPEEILKIKVCDPACGSGTFPVAALRFLTDALYNSLHSHGRIKPDGSRAVVQLLSEETAEKPPVEEKLGLELLPCPPDDPLFEPRLKAILRRYVVERSIYGVDLDPLAVELCRLALWIETMDRTLPFSFLDHKIKCGNSLVGAWFDQFQHYPVMAWKNREGGDKGHTNGVHFEKDARGSAIKAFVKDTLTPDLRTFLSGRTLFSEDLQEKAAAVHAEALGVLSRLHELPVQDSAERARMYHEELQNSAAYRSLKSAMDLWCACWFWPADQLEHAPLPTTFAAPAETTRTLADGIAARKKFFHWELEFPDVFCASNSGFDAILGNPPWDIAKPNSREFFSNIDPLYRSYGKQEALSYQTRYFQDTQAERSWLDYNGDFRAQSNLMSYAAGPFGDPKESEKGQDRFTIARGGANDAFHLSWRAARAKSSGFADPEHPYRHQGSADLNLYKLFLEQAHALLRDGGRLGFIVPSGLYSDHGTGSLRQLFLNRCRWEWLFGFENRDGIFEIHRSYKFNPVIIEKGGATEAIRTAFMRRKLEDWEEAESFATPYTRAQVERFSPRSKAILEIQSKRDLEILEKIYSNSVLLGDEGPDGWGIKYATEFHMTNDSKLFPPRPKWEADGYRPDEYSRWLKGDWRPIGELWAELGIRNEERGMSQNHHSSFLVPHSLRCAQPPYDTLPIPRADIPPGIILSRTADAWIRESSIPEVQFRDAAGNPLVIKIGRGKKAIELEMKGPAIGLPLYEGRMIGQFDFSEKGWVSGKGRTALWHEIPWSWKQIEPQFVMGARVFQSALLQKYLTQYSDFFGQVSGEAEAERLDNPEEFASWWYGQQRRIAFMDVTSATNTRTVIAACLPCLPCGNKAPILTSLNSYALPGLLSSFAFDFEARRRLTGLTLNYFILSELGLPRDAQKMESIQQLTMGLSACDRIYSDAWLLYYKKPLCRSFHAYWALSLNERYRMRCMLDALILSLFRFSIEDASFVLLGANPLQFDQNIVDPKGFWRVDKDKDPELRHTVLTLVAFHDLEEKIRACGGDREKGIEAFLNQNNGEGWMLPETLRLADYGLGHDERAREHQPVASRLGPRFYDWQLAQSPEESWRECHLHARNLLGESGYKKLLAEIEGGAAEEPSELARVAEPPAPWKKNQGQLF